MTVPLQHFASLLSLFMHASHNCSKIWANAFNKLHKASTKTFTGNWVNKQSYSLIQYKGYNPEFKFFDGVQFRKYFISLPAFYLIIWLMESPKSFEKTSILKIWQLVFFRGVKTQFGEIPLKSYIFRHDKNWFSPILPHNIYFSD